MNSSNFVNLKNQMINIPTPSSISYFWNFGSLLGVCLMLQILSGIFLSMHYESSIDKSFDSVVSMCNDMNFGWFLRSIHANGASAFFICIYLHIGRGLYYVSSDMSVTWVLGVFILLSLMATGFLGYVLPWGQMSFWGATVITNLVSAVPYLGTFLVQWLWGGFSVGQPTLIRFFSIHFILPFVVAGLVMLHIMSLHVTGSSNPLGVSNNAYKINFHPYFVYKDLAGFVMFFLLFIFTVTAFPDLFMDPDNFTVANPMNTPPHIQPEWYFLFAYAILRSVPNKLGGVIALVMSILILAILPFMKTSVSLKTRFNPFMKLALWIQFSNFFILTWIGSMPVEMPFVMVGQLVSLFYFTLFFFMGMFM